MQNREIVRCMATCHSLTMIQDELCGDPLDLKMFLSTGWELDEPTEDTSAQYDTIAPTVVRPPATKEKKADDSDGAGEIGIIRQFPFSSARQCMSVVVRPLNGDHFVAYCKGSPEKIEKIANRETLPKNFAKLLEKYTAHGYRVIALSVRHLPATMNLRKIQRMESDEVESGVDFLGLVILENRLKPETTPIIKQLQVGHIHRLLEYTNSHDCVSFQRAQLRTVMVTGDNVNTALSVARECGMISSSRAILVKAREDETGDAKIGFHHVMSARHGNRRKKSASGSVGGTISSVDKERCREVIIEMEKRLFVIYYSSN